MIGCFLMVLLAAKAAIAVEVGEMARVADGWTASVVAEVDQSYAGWDVEIGDADNDGQNEILTTGCPDSRLYLFKRQGDQWETRLIAENLAQRSPGMGLAVKVADLNNDGKNEVVVGTGQESAETAFFYVIETDGRSVTRQVVSRPECNKSGSTHNLAIHDLDGDGLQEVVSAYCGGGEVIRYDLDADLEVIQARKIHQLSGSGEESLIADVDNDGAVEYITSNGFRPGQARVEIFEFDAQGELVAPPRIAIEGHDGRGCFYASITVGDVDNDGKNEMIVGWKIDQKINKATLIGYKVGETADPAYVFERETEDLDMAYFEKMMAVADADNDGKNELVVSTRGDEMSEFITSKHLGHVFMYSIGGSGEIERELLCNFDDRYAESSWVAVGDADNDRLNEIVLATGKGDRTKPGVSYVVLLDRRPAAGGPDIIPVAEALNPQPDVLPTVRVVRERLWGQWFPMCSMRFPNVPAFQCDAWCYESQVDFVDARPIEGGAVEMRHRDKQNPDALVLTTITPQPGRVLFAARVVRDPERGAGPLPDALPGLNLCWQLRHAPAFASAPDRYPEFVKRCFIFTERGRTFLGDTQRGKIPVQTADHEYNNPPWVQMYVAASQPVPVTLSNAWAAYSQDRYVTPVIGTVSRDAKYLAAIANDSADSMAQAWHDCMHNNPKWLPAESAPAERRWRLAVYAMENDPAALLEKVNADFPSTPPGGEVGKQKALR